MLPTAAALMLPVGMWLWLCRDWPGRLGFFSDDWMILLHPEVGTWAAFRDMLELIPSRPVSVPFLWAAQVVVDWSPARSQMLDAVMLLLTAFGVGYLAAVLASAMGWARRDALVGMGVAAAAFIVFPSSIGIFCWGVGMQTAVPAVPLFCVGSALLVRSEGGGWQLALGLLIGLLSHLAYEAFYFQEATILVFALVLGRRKADVRFLRSLVLVVAVNAGCILFNRVVTGGIHKTFHPDFLKVFAGGYLHILPIFGHAVRESGPFVGIGLAGVSVLGFALLSRRAGPYRVALGFLILTMGALAAGLLYASAGYGLAVEGVSARVGVVVATFFSLAIGLEAAAASNASARSGALSAVFVFSALVFILALGWSSRARVGEWADVWTYELARLDRLPEPAWATDQRDRAVLAVDSRAPAYVSPATAPWEIQGAALWALFKRTADGNRHAIKSGWDTSSPRTLWYATPPNWFNRWTGSRFEQGPCGSAVIYQSPAAELWVWATHEATMRKVEPPWQQGCD